MFSNASSGSATSPTEAAVSSRTASSALDSRSPDERPLQKAVGVDVDLDAGRTGGADAGEPIAQYRLEAHLAARLDKKPAAMATAQHGERRGGWAEQCDAGQLRR